MRQTTVKKINISVLKRAPPSCCCYVIMESFCRVCFIPVIHEFAHASEKKRKQFKYVTEIKVKHNEILPFQLCENCTEVLQNAAQFKKKSRSSDKLIQNYLAQNIDCDVPEFLAFIKDTELTNHRVQSSDNRDCDGKESVCTSIRNFMSDMLPDGVVVEPETTLMEVIKEELDDSIDSCWLQEDVKSVLDVDKFFSPYISPVTKIPEKTLIDPRLLQNNDNIDKNEATITTGQYVDVTKNDDFDEFLLTEPPEGSSTPLRYDAIDEVSNCENIAATRGSLDTENVLMKTNQKSRRIIKCEVCDESFTQMRQLSTHTYRDHGVKLKSGYRRKVSHCEHCDKSFADPSNYRRHLVTHNTPKEDKSYVCNICQLEFKKSHAFKLHFRTHESQTNSPKVIDNIDTCENYSKEKFLCTVCGAKCTTHSNYLTHCRRHEKAFTISCDICGRNFYRSYDLKVHKRTHTGEKPYHCKRCPAKFARCDKLTKHMKQHEDQTNLQSRPELGV